MKLHGAFLFYFEPEVRGQQPSWDDLVARGEGESAPSWPPFISYSDIKVTFSLSEK